MDSLPDPVALIPNQVEPEGLEPSTSPMPTERSPTELRSHNFSSSCLPTGAAARARTGDLFITREALFHLSYGDSVDHPIHLDDHDHDRTTSGDDGIRTRGLHAGGVTL